MGYGNDYLRMSTIQSTSHHSLILLKELLTRGLPYAHIRMDQQVMFAIYRGEKPIKPPQESLGKPENAKLWDICQLCWMGVDGRPPISRIASLLGIE